MFRASPYHHLGHEMGLLQRQMDDLFGDATRLNLVCVPQDIDDKDTTSTGPSTPGGTHHHHTNNHLGVEPSSSSGVNVVKDPKTGAVILTPPRLSSVHNFTLRPRVDVRFDKESNSLVLHLELPGVPKEDIKINYKDGVLTISGQVKKDKGSDDKDAGWIYQERQVGAFSRSFPLPDTDENKIKASFENGILKVTCPQKKPLESEGKTIAVA